MAIIIEEEKKKSHIFTVAGWLAFLAVAAVAVYYIFFSSPQAALLPSSGGLSAIAPLTQSAVQPQSVENSAALQALHTTITAPTSTGPTPKMRPNPFLAP
jgi:predicted transcriptional regulator